MRLLCSLLLLLLGLVSARVVAVQSDFSIVENSGTGQIVAHLNISTTATGYRFNTHDGVCNHYFSIEPSGTLRTRIDIDREDVEERNQKSDILSCNVLYSDPFPRDYTIRIAILDVNDNVPRFAGLNQTVISEINEGTSVPFVVIRLEPTDRDKGENGTTEFNITSGNESGHFRIEIPLGSNENSSGRILSLVEELESTTPFNLTVTIRDKAKDPRVFEQVIIVIVKQICDEPPTFPTTSIIYNVREDHLSGSEHPFGNITISNYNEQCGDIVYSLEDGNTGEVAVNPSTGQLYLTEQQDYEDRSQPNITFGYSATYGSTLPDGNIHVTVTMVDVNDEPPVLCPPLFHILCRPNQNKFIDEQDNPSLLTLYVEDDDRTYENKDISSQVNVINSDPRIGEIEAIVTNQRSGISSSIILLKLNGSLDREIVSTFNLTVTVYNEAEPFLSDSINLTFSVSDVNDNRPEFQQDGYYLRLAEGSPVSKNIFPLEAYDGDEGKNGTVTYSLVSVDNVIARNWFRISPTNGTLSVASPDIDYLTVSGRVTLSISATDNGDEPLSSTVRVTIDISPMLTFSPNGYVEFEQFNLVESDSYSIYLELRTKWTEGIVFFQQRPSGSVILLELKNGHLYFQHDSNSSVSPVAVSDDKWYSIRIQRQNNVSLQVWETQGAPVVEALMGATLMGCNGTEPPLNGTEPPLHGTEPPVQQADSNSLFIGGVGLLFLYDSVSLSSSEFVGAIRNFIIDDTQVDLGCPTSDMNVLRGFHYSDGCSTEQEAFCENEHTAGCVDFALEPYCKCRGGFPPASCQPISNPNPDIQGAEDSFAPIRFFGNNQVSLELDYTFFSELEAQKRVTDVESTTPATSTQRRKRSIFDTPRSEDTVQVVEVTFRPIEVSTSILLHSRTSTLSHELKIEHRESAKTHIFYTVTYIGTGSQKLHIPIRKDLKNMTVYNVRLAIGKEQILLSIEDDEGVNTESGDWDNNYATFVDQPTTRLSIGGANGREYFQGCISRIAIDSIVFPLTGLLALSPEEGGFVPGTSQSRLPEMYCDLCNQTVCPGNATCVREAMGEPACSCNPGYELEESECIPNLTTGPVGPLEPAGFGEVNTIIVSVCATVLIISIVIGIVIIRVCRRRKLNKQKRTYSVSNVSAECNGSMAHSSRLNEYVHMEPRGNPIMTTLCAPNGTLRQDRGSSVSTFQEHAEDADPEVETPQHFSRRKSTVSAESGIKTDTDQEASLRDVPHMEDSGNEKDTDYSANESVSDDLSSICFPQSPADIQVVGSSNSIPHLASTTSPPHPLTPKERQMLIPLRPPSTALSASEFEDTREHDEEDDEDDTDIEVFPYQMYHSSLTRNSAAKPSGRQGSEGEASRVSSTGSGGKWYKASTASDTEREKERSRVNKAFYSQRSEPAHYPPPPSEYNTLPSFQAQNDRSIPYQNRRRSRKPINLPESPGPRNEKLQHYQFPLEDTHKRDPRLHYDNHRLKHEYSLPKGYPFIALSTVSSSSGRPRHNAEAMLASAPPHSPASAVPNYPRHHSTSGPGFTLPQQAIHYPYSRSYSSESKNRREPEQKFQDLKSVTTINPIAYWEMQDRMNKTAVDQVDPYQILSEPYIQFEDVSTDPSVIESQITQDDPEHQSFCSQGGRERPADMMPPQLSLSEFQDDSTIATDTDLGPPLNIFPSADCSSQYTPTLVATSSGSSTPKTPKITLPSSQYQFDV